MDAIMKKLQHQLEEYFNYTGRWPKVVVLSIDDMSEYEKEANQNLRFYEEPRGVVTHFFMFTRLTTAKLDGYCPNCGAEADYIRCSYCNTPTDWIQIK